jgi:glycerol-1-phosphate dehydrogenase [NAD(P)+]
MSADSKSHGGVLDDLVAGRWIDPATGRRHSIPIEDIVVAKNLQGREAELIARRHAGKRITVVSDSFTRQALGERVFAAVRNLGQVDEFVWERPRCTPDGVEELTQATRSAEALVAVGSGTVSDSVKYATFLDKREYSVFATSPMNAYTTPTASVSFGGFKKSITCHSAKGVFFDLRVIAKCPRRLVSAAFADVVCRTTAQVDWLMSHLLFDTPYSETPYVLLSYDEDKMIASAGNLLNGDIEALGTLTRVSAIMGLGTSFTGTTHCGSMAEHMISHFIDMFAGKNHPGTSHGEQVGVATLTMSRLQNAILRADAPPRLRPTVIPVPELNLYFGAETASTMIEQAQRKALAPAQADCLNRHLAEGWDDFAGRLRAVMRPFEELREAMRIAGCQLTAADLGLDPAFYQCAIRYARFIRDRFTMLDLAGDGDALESFAREAD